MRMNELFKINKYLDKRFERAGTYLSNNCYLTISVNNKSVFGIATNKYTTAEKVIALFEEKIICQ